MSDTEIVKVQAPHPERVHVFATNSEEMAKATTELAAWFSARLEREKADLKMLEENLASAVKHKWKTSGLQSAVSKAKATVAYYEKCKAAVDEGYAIVPDMGAQWFALRTTREKPPRDEHTNLIYEPTESEISVSPELIGEGQYVSDVAKGRHSSYKNEKLENRYTSWNTEFKDVEFPVMFVSPEIVEATAQAMQLKIFDAFGIVGGKRKDPMIIGVVRGPKSGYTQKEMFFLVGWFLDTRNL